jgi:hypothetical protein
MFDVCCLHPKQLSSQPKIFNDVIAVSCGKLTPFSSAGSLGREYPQNAPHVFGASFPD